jgi:hypothetical protein
MGRSWLIPTIIFLLIPFSGCTHAQLRHSTNRTQETMSDLRYMHLLDNLAMMVRNPATVPNPVAINGGVVQISDNAAAATGFTWNVLNMKGINQYALGPFSGSRTVSEQWSMSPLHNPEKLRLMRYAYQFLLDSELVYRDDGVQKLRTFLGDEEFATAIPKGWFCVGSKKDVPANARYCGRYHDVYVWVTDEGMDGLSRFYLTILRIALMDQERKTADVTRSYEGAPGEDTLRQTQVRTVEELPLKDQPTPSSKGGEFPVTGQGLFFVPTGR